MGRQTAQSTASPHRHLVGCDGWGSRLTIYITNSPIIIDHHRSPTLREAIDFSITSHFQMASTDLARILGITYSHYTTAPRMLQWYQTLHCNPTIINRLVYSVCWYATFVQIFNALKRNLELERMPKRARVVFDNYVTYIYFGHRQPKIFTTLITESKIKTSEFRT